MTSRSVTPTLALIAEVAATFAVALWLGGMLALGAFAAPVVFGELPMETAGSVMGTIFANFDAMVLVLAGVLVVAEVVRVAVEGVHGKLAAARLATAAVLVILALISAVWLGPAINDMFEHGARLGVGKAGARLARLHVWAERVGKLAFAVAAGWLALGVIVHRRAASARQSSAGAERPQPVESEQP